mgnify:CR=1 FL=1
MSFEKLLDNKKIQRLLKKQELGFELVEKDIQTATDNLKLDNNWAAVIAYESVLRAINRLMNFLGYRAIGKEHHKNMFEFLKETRINQQLVEYFDNIRKKRNNFLYRDVESISKEEAEEIIKKAGEFVQEIRTFVQEIRTKNNLKTKGNKKEVALKNKKVN